jgi:hypothetical protein
VKNSRSGFALADRIPPMGHIDKACRHPFFVPFVCAGDAGPMLFVGSDVTRAYRIAVEKGVGFHISLYSARGDKLVETAWAAAQADGGGSAWAAFPDDPWRPTIVLRIPWPGAHFYLFAYRYPATVVEVGAFYVANEIIENGHRIKPGFKIARPNGYFTMTAGPGGPHIVSPRRWVAAPLLAKLLVAGLHDIARRRP